MWLRRAGGFAGRPAPANVLLKRRYDASDNQTNIQVSIFPNCRFLFSRTCCDHSFFMRDARSINEMNSNSPQSGTMLILTLIAVFCRVREFIAFCELRTIRSTPDAHRHLTQSCQCGTNESRTPWNKTFPQQVFSLATRSRFGSMRERQHAPELYSVQKREVASATPD